MKTTITNLLEIIRHDGDDYREIDGHGLPSAAIFVLDDYDNLVIIFHRTYAVTFQDDVIGRLNYAEYPTTDDFFDGLGNVVG